MASKLMVGLVVGVAFAGLSNAASAESFGPLPGPDQSRCAPLSANRTVLDIGQTIVLHAGPITAACGAPASSTHYAWQTTNPADPADAPGLVQVKPCSQDAPQCVYRARLFTQKGMWQAVGIDGTSPDGGWGASEPYAIRYGKYFGVAVQINDGNFAQPSSVRVTGNRRNDSTTANQAGVFEFAVTRGTYTFHWHLHGRNHAKTFKLHAPPGGSVSLNL